MLIAYWIVAGLLALAYLAAGIMKIVRSPDALVATGIAWAKDVPLPAVRLIGVVEVLGAIGLILPPLTGIAPILAPRRRDRARHRSGRSRRLPPPPR